MLCRQNLPHHCRWTGWNKESFIRPWEYLIGFWPNYYTHDYKFHVRPLAQEEGYLKLFHCVRDPWNRTRFKFLNWSCFPVWCTIGKLYHSTVSVNRYHADLFVSRWDIKASYKVHCTGSIKNTRFVTHYSEWGIAVFGSVKTCADNLTKFACNWWQIKVVTGKISLATSSLIFR